MAFSFFVKEEEEVCTHTRVEERRERDSTHFERSASDGHFDGVLGGPTPELLLI
jgi:hypothetical protein